MNDFKHLFFIIITITFLSCSESENLSPSVSANYNSSTNKVEITGTDSDGTIDSVEFDYTDITSQDTDSSRNFYAEVTPSSTGDLAIIVFDNDMGMAETTVNVPLPPDSASITSFTSSNYSPNINESFTIESVIGNGTLVGYDTDDDGDYDDSSSVLFSTFGRKILEAKATAEGGDDWKTLDVYVQGNFDISLSSSAVQHDHDSSTTDVTATLSNVNGTYDTVKFYADGTEIGSFANSGSSYGIKQIDFVGTKDITAKLYENGQEVAEGNLAQSLEGLNSAPYQVKSGNLNFTPTIPETIILTIDTVAGLEDSNGDDVFIKCKSVLPSYLSYDEETRELHYDGTGPVSNDVYTFDSEDSHGDSPSAILKSVNFS